MKSSKIHAIVIKNNTWLHPICSHSHETSDFVVIYSNPGPKITYSGLIKMTSARTDTTWKAIEQQKIEYG